MGYFSDSFSFGDSLVPFPLTKARIGACLERMDWGADEREDDFIAGWKPGTFLFFTLGEKADILCVRGYWRGRLDDADWVEALEACNDWNATRLWPKAYTGREDDNVYLYVEHNVSYPSGITDNQLDHHLGYALDGSMRFFEQLNETFPEAWAKVEAAIQASTQAADESDGQDEAAGGSDESADQNEPADISAEPADQNDPAGSSAES